MKPSLLARMKYRTKMILCYSLMAALPLSLGLVYLYRNLVVTSTSQVHQAVAARMEREVSSVQLQLSEAAHSAYLLSTNAELGRFLSPNYYDVVELIETLNNEIMPLCSWFEAAGAGLSDFYIFSNICIINKSPY